MLDDIYVAGETVKANLSAMARQLDAMPDGAAVAEYEGAESGLGTHYGAALSDAASELERQLGLLQAIIAQHSDALRASVTALTGTDELAASDATALGGVLDDASDAAAPASGSVPPASAPGTDASTGAY